MSGSKLRITLYMYFVLVLVGIAIFAPSPALPYVSDDLDFVPMKEERPSTGRLFVKTDPTGARIRVLNIRPKFYQGMKLEQGKYHVEVSAQGYEMKKQWVKLAAGEHKKVVIHLEPVAAARKVARSRRQTVPPGYYSSKTYVIPSINYKMVYIPPGTFMMGSPTSEKGRANDEKQHKVALTKGFYKGVTEVTQLQWRKIMANNPSRFKNCGDDCPVEMVSWNDVQEFIRKLNKREGTKKYRLPTEAEWEYACRAGSTKAFANGGISELKYGHDPNLDRMGWYSGYKTHPVAQKKPNAWGLYDMHGNVWEWCQDWYGDYPSGNVTDPKGRSSGKHRVFRGGGWDDLARHCRSALRTKNDPRLRAYNIGFRLARDY